MTKRKEVTGVGDEEKQATTEFLEAVRSGNYIIAQEDDGEGD